MLLGKLGTRKRERNIFSNSAEKGEKKERKKNLLYHYIYLGRVFLTLKLLWRIMEVGVIVLSFFSTFLPDIPYAVLFTDTTTGGFGTAVLASLERTLALFAWYTMDFCLVQVGFAIAIGIPISVSIFFLGSFALFTAALSLSKVLHPSIPPSVLALSLCFYTTYRHPRLL